jgi:hypothetical protein
MSQSLELLCSNPESVLKQYNSIPEWFAEKNVTLFNSVPSPSTQSTQTITNEFDSRSLHNEGITLSPFIRGEILAHVSTSLLIKSGSLDTPTTRKAHIHIQSSAGGAIYFLGELVENIARDLEADIVRLDGQDLEELLESLDVGDTAGQHDAEDYALVSTLQYDFRLAGVIGRSCAT